MGRKWVSVRLSKPSRRKKHKVKAHTQKTSKAFRRKKHKRRPRRTNAQIKRAQARKKARKTRKSKKTRKRP